MADKKKGAGLRWAIRLLVIAAIAYFFHPRFLPPKPTQPGKLGSDDVVTITVTDKGDPAIYQRLTIYGDGRAKVEWTRKQEDIAELPEALRMTSSDRETKIITFASDKVLSEEKAKQLLGQIVDTGVIDLQPLAGSESGRMSVSFKLGSYRGETAGPAWVTQAYNWQPPIWKNRLRWQNLGLLIDSDSDLKDLLHTKDIVLENK